MPSAKDIVNNLLREDADDPVPYVNWLGKKSELGELEDIQFGVLIHTSDERTIRENATEAEVDVEAEEFWKEINDNVALIEDNALQILHEAGLLATPSGHNGDALVASVWIPNTEKKTALLKAIVNWADGEWPNTTSGTMDTAFGYPTSSKLYQKCTEAARFIDVTIEFTGTEALKEWMTLNLVEAQNYHVKVRPNAEFPIRESVDDPDAPTPHYTDTLHHNIERTLQRLGFSLINGSWYKEELPYTFRVNTYRQHRNFCMFNVWSIHGPAFCRAVDLAEFHDFYELLVKELKLEPDVETALRHVRNKLEIEENAENPDLDAQQYLNQIHDLKDITNGISNYGLSVNSIRHWGRWVVLGGFAYWAVDAKTEERLPPEYFRGQIEKYMAELGITRSHVKVGPIREDEGTWFQLAIPKSQVEWESWQGFSNKLPPDRDWLPENTDPDDPSLNVDRHTADLDIHATMKRLGFVYADKPDEKFWLKHFPHVQWRVAPTNTTNVYKITTYKRIGFGNRTTWTDTNHFTCHVSQLEEYLREEGAVFEAVDDPDDPTVNVGRHLASMEPGPVLAELGFQERWPSWKCADPEYMWWEKFDQKTGLKWTVGHKSDDASHVMDISIYNSRVLPGHALHDWQEVGGFYCHVGELKKKLEKASRMQWVVPNDDTVWGQNVRALNAQEAPDAFIPNRPIQEAEDVDPEKFIKSQPIEVLARVTNDRTGESVRFNCADWFQHASLEKLIALAKANFERSYAADDVAHYFYDTTLKEFFRNEDAGFEVRISIPDAQSWIEHNRPDWYPYLWPDDMQVESKKETVDYPAVYVAGKIFIGPSHYHVVQALAGLGIYLGDESHTELHHGWWTSRNRFLDSDQDINKLIAIDKRFTQRTGEEPGVQGETLPKARQMTGVREVHENIDDPTQELMQNAFDVPAILKRKGYESNTADEQPLEWYKVFRRNPTGTDLMLMVKRRGLGGEANEGDAIYDITLYHSPVQKKEWTPITHFYGYNNKQVERALLKLERRIKANNLRGCRDEDLLAESVDDLDDPQTFVKDFVDKDLGVTFLLRRSGESSVYADEPFCHDWIIYSNDKGASTRTFEGYLRQHGDGWIAYAKRGIAIPDTYPTQEAASYAVYRYNHQQRESVDEPVPDPNVDDPDDPTTVLNAHMQGLADVDSNPQIKSHTHGKLMTELKALGFEHSTVEVRHTILGEPEIPGFWSKNYRGAGSTRTLWVRLTTEPEGPVLSVRSRAMKAPTPLKPRSVDHIGTIIRDLDAAQQRNAEDGLTPELEVAALRRVIDHHYRWCRS